jgi:catechol 2,3-dioxygenase
LNRSGLNQTNAAAFKAGAPLPAIKQEAFGLGCLSPGYGRAYAYHTPDGHKMKLLWDVEYAQASADQKTALLIRTTKRPSQGVPVRRIDHVNLYCSNVTRNRDALIELLGFRLNENLMLDNGAEAAAWLRTSSLVHDVAFSLDPTESRGRLHHLAFWYGIPQHLMDVIWVGSDLPREFFLYGTPVAGEPEMAKKLVDMERKAG